LKGLPNKTQASARFVEGLSEALVILHNAIAAYGSVDGVDYARKQGIDIGACHPRTAGLT
jgi:hypothetical protein